MLEEDDGGCSLDDIVDDSVKDFSCAFAEEVCKVVSILSITEEILVTSKQQANQRQILM